MAFVWNRHLPLDLRHRSHSREFRLSSSLLFSLFALFCLNSTGLRAQQIAGDWQGTLHGSKDLRLVLKIVKSPAGFNGTLYLLEKGASLPTAPIASRGNGVLIEIPGAGVTYPATFSTDGNCLTGQWTQQSGSALPLTLTRATPETAWAIPATPASLAPLSADAHPTIEVATFKPSSPDEQGKGYRLRGRDFSMNNYTLLEMIAFAFNLHPSQITGGPDWLAKEHFDLVAQQDLDGLPSPSQLKRMLQKLLEDRLALVHHVGTRTLPVFLLTASRPSPKLVPDTTDKTGFMNMGFANSASGITLNMHNATMAEFALETLQGVVLDRPVLDRTGLSPRYDFTLTWTPDESQFGGQGGHAPKTDPADAAPSLFPAIQEQLGLKLEATKAQAEVLIVDSIQRPSAN